MQKKSKFENFFHRLHKPLSNEYEVASLRGERKMKEEKKIFQFH